MSVLVRLYGAAGARELAMTPPARIVAGALLTVALAERTGDDELAHTWWAWLDMLVELRRDTWPS